MNCADAAEEAKARAATAGKTRNAQAAAKEAATKIGSAKVRISNDSAPYWSVQFCRRLRCSWAKNPSERREDAAEVPRYS